MLIVEDPTVTVKCKIVIKVLFLFLDFLSKCNVGLFTSISFLTKC
jgi:hypothetical protein